MFYKVENIPDEQTMQAVVAELLPLVPFVRRDKALRYKHLHGQYCCLRTWQMLHALLVEHAFIPADFPLAELTYTEDEQGKPSLDSHFSTLNVQRSTIHFSLSHTKTALAVAIDRQPVGIDVETIVSAGRLDRTFLDHTMCADEQTCITQSTYPCLTFTELWTRKEALVKAIGTGVNLSTLPNLLQFTHPYNFITTHTDTYACSVAVLQSGV